jgi:AcrR family transcriptional regulator
MPPTRDEEEYESKRRQIMEGALNVFADKGFEAATNKEIARAARINSPGLIYHYFKDKSDLFRQTMEQYAPALQLILHSDDLMDLPPREFFMQIGTAFLKSLNSRVTASMFKMLIGEAVRRPAVAKMLGDIGPARGLAVLRRYLDHQMDLGNLRRMDTAIAARCFMGPLLAYFLTREVFPQPDIANLPPEQMVENVVEVFLRGMEPRSG